MGRGSLGLPLSPGVTSDRRPDGPTDLTVDGQEELALLRKSSGYTRPRKGRLSEMPVHRRVLTVRGAYRLAYKRSLTLGGCGLSGSAAVVLVAGALPLSSE
jgi:hypothetical protein